MKTIEIEELEGDDKLLEMEMITDAEVEWEAIKAIIKIYDNKECQECGEKAYQFDQKKGKIKYEGREITREMVFTKNSVIFGYSGDTPFDPEFIKWFNDTQLLVHESTYFEHDPTFHSDVHTVFSDLITEIKKLERLLVFLPAHISQRYTWDEIIHYIEEKKLLLPNIVVYPPKAMDIIQCDKGTVNIHSLDPNDRW